MATDKKYVEDLLEGLWEVRVCPMMGDYVLYCREKVIGVVCDNMLFIKITPASERILRSLETPIQPPYEGAKPYFKVNVREKQFLQDLFFAVADNLPMPRKRK